MKLPYLRRVKTQSDNEPHFHKQPDGSLVKCFHKCKAMFRDPTFWIATTISFPLEHFIWEKVWPLSLLTKWLGL